MQFRYQRRHSQTNVNTRLPVLYGKLLTLPNLSLIKSQDIEVNCGVNTQLPTATSKAYSLIFAPATPNKQHFQDTRISTNRIAFKYVIVVRSHITGYTDRLTTLPSEKKLEQNTFF